MGVGCKVYDTPGLQTTNRVSDLMKEVESVKRVLKVGYETYKGVRIDPNGSVWLGALCRIDNLGTQPLVLSFAQSWRVSINKFTVEGATLNYLKNRGSLLRPCYSLEDISLEPKFVKSEFDIDLDMDLGVHP